MHHDVTADQVAISHRRSDGMAVTVLAVFTLTIFLGALLVFGIQPVAARLLLPAFGGSPAVWSAVSVFFQGALLAGYAYSFLITRYLPARRQPVLHMATLAAPLLFLPVALAVDASHASSSVPALAVMWVLTIGLAVPFVVACTTGPLLQRWFSFTGHPSSSDPYFLYAASNAGSLLVLLAYPFLIEPRLTLGEQSALWGYGYLAFAILSAACGLIVVRRAPTAVINQTTGPAQTDAGDAASIAWGRRARWIVLGAVPAALSLATTQHISTDVAAFPLLWIAPLALYLASFVVAFSQRNPVTSRISSRILPVPVAAAVAVPWLDPPIVVSIVVSLAVLFVAAVMCHTLLAEDRPPTARLTEFYLLMSVGGALGGAFVSLLAPTIFDQVMEYPVAIAAVLLLRPRSGTRLTRTLAKRLLAVAALATAVMAVAATAPTVLPAAWMWIGLAVILLVLSRWRPAFAASVALLLGGVAFGGVGIHVERTFFGVYRVIENAEHRGLIHGTTLQGLQHLRPGSEDLPSTYYHHTGPIGQVFETWGPDQDRVGVLGLGVGTLAAYGLPGQHFTFWEIDPAVVEMAQDPSLFTFLSGSDADIEVVVADGRLGVASDPRLYDLLVLDAFSSDAIPVHLLTRQAVEIYEDRLAEGGLMAFHITNRHLELESVLGTLARDMGLAAIVREDAEISEAEQREGKAESKWVLMARSAGHLEPLASDPRWHPPAVDRRSRAWTDDFADILSTLR